jgi:hypothetical protein
LGLLVAESADALAERQLPRQHAQELLDHVLTFFEPAHLEAHQPDVGPLVVDRWRGRPRHAFEPGTVWLSSGTTSRSRSVSASARRRTRLFLHALQRVVAERGRFEARVGRAPLRHGRRQRTEQRRDAEQQDAERREHFDEREAVLGGGFAAVVADQPFQSSFACGIGTTNSTVRPTCTRAPAGWSMAFVPRCPRRRPRSVSPASASRSASTRRAP